MEGFQNEAERIAHIRALFSYGLGVEENGGGGQRKYYYSFCEQRWMQDSCTWHCRVCGECQDWTSWHCARCIECVWGTDLKCDGCGGVSDSYHELRAP